MCVSSSAATVFVSGADRQPRPCVAELSTSPPLQISPQAAPDLSRLSPATLSRRCHLLRPHHLRQPLQLATDVDWSLRPASCAAEPTGRTASSFQESQTGQLPPNTAATASSSPRRCCSVKRHCSTIAGYGFDLILS